MAPGRYKELLDALERLRDYLSVFEGEERAECLKLIKDIEGYLAQAPN